MPLYRACVLSLGGIRALAAAAAGAANGTCGADTCDQGLGRAAGAPCRRGTQGSMLLQFPKPRIAPGSVVIPDSEESEEEPPPEFAGPLSPTEVSPLTLPSAASASGSSARLKLFEWNVWYKNKDTLRIAQVVKPNNPDVIGFDEFTASRSSMRAHLNQEIPGRSYEMQPGWSHFVGYGTYIFYDSNRFDALEGGVKTVHCQGTRGGDRAANWVVLREKATQGLLIAGGIHLSYCSKGCDSVHECELGKMYDRFYAMKDKYPAAHVVWMGDLNRSPNSRLVRNLLQGKLGSRQVLAVQDLSRSQQRTYMTGGTIDHIFGEAGAFARVSGGRTGQGQNGQRLNGADHFPIYAEVQWSPAGGSAPPPAASPAPALPPAAGPAPPPPTSGGPCDANLVQRRRRASSCSCRRRSGASSSGTYRCEGDSIVMTG